MAKRALGNSDGNSDGRDKLKENFNKDKNRPNTMYKVTIKDWQDMIRVRTHSFLNTQEYKIFRDLFEEYKSKYNVAQTINLIENVFRNLQAGNKHIMNNPKWHSEMKSFCKLETIRLNKIIKDKYEEKEGKK